MGEDLLTGLSMDNYLPSTLLSMDSSAVCHEELDQEPNWPMSLSRPPPDINVPLSAERSSPPTSHPWNLDSFDLLDVGLAPQVNESEALVHVPKTVRKCLNRLDCVWGAWFFFTYYFKPVLNEKSKCKIVRDKKGVSGFEKSDLELDVFLVQYDLENLYMWVFKERPENALGKMQLRSYMNGHFRQGEHPFPFSVDKGFVRSHRMQRKHYRGLSNPQCVHGIEVVAAPNLDGVDEEELKRWVELTGRDLNFSVPPKASEFCAWRNLPVMEFELDKPLPHVKIGSNHNQTKLLNGSGLHLSAHPSINGNGSLVDLSHHCNKRKKDVRAHGVDEHCCLNNIQLNGRARDAELHAIEPPWINDFSGVMRNIYGPVTAAKTIYEDDQGYLLIVSLPFADLKRVKVTWWNNLTHGIVKISSVSTSCMPYVKRDGRTFKLTDAFPEHCPPGEFVREILLPTRIPDDAKLEAYEDESGTGLEILVPKHTIGPEEHEVQVCLRPPHSVVNELL